MSTVLKAVQELDARGVPLVAMEVAASDGRPARAYAIMASAVALVVAVALFAWRGLDDGKVPGDNPFAGKTGVRPEIYSYGHRNPQAVTRDPVTGAIWATEHGPKGGDELNLILPARNYGWPVVTFGSIGVSMR